MSDLKPDCQRRVLYKLNLLVTSQKIGPVLIKCLAPWPGRSTMAEAAGTEGGKGEAWLGPRGGGARGAPWMRVKGLKSVILVRYEIDETEPVGEKER